MTAMLGFPQPAGFDCCGRGHGTSRRPVARRPQVRGGRQQTRAAVAAKAEHAVAFAAEEPAHLAARVAMIDTQRLAGSLADGTGAILPLAHGVVIDQREPVDLAVALPALPFAAAGALAFAKIRIVLQPEPPALAHLLLVRLAVAAPGGANLLPVFGILRKPFLVPRAVREH